MIDKAIALKKEQPVRSDETINQFLEQQFARRMAKSTLYRHLKHAGATRLKLGVACNKPSPNSTCRNGADHAEILLAPTAVPHTQRDRAAGTVDAARMAAQRSRGPFLFSLATTGDNGRVIGISQGRTGRFFYDGVVTPAESDTFMGGFLTLQFNDGRSLYNAFNLSIRR
jgi:hypothetical protein